MRKKIISLNSANNKKVLYILPDKRYPIYYFNINKPIRPIKSRLKGIKKPVSCCVFVSSTLCNFPGANFNLARILPSDQHVLFQVPIEGIEPLGVW